MKYVILVHGSQRDFDAATSAEELTAIGDYLREFNRELEEAGEFVDAQGLAAPVHTRRVELKQGVPVVTDGPYAETQEVVIGYWMVDCESFDRATEIAARLSLCPGPESAVDVRPVMGAEPGPEL
ncbi:YciI family protein [Amycolatopsis nigrescens]|uniref:YciI family protein n=1 Tax=Amycolatopsis nigrescens TaxID=381445 RepID=UPI00035D4703|nr:YciI family protein [Amycolatopsis nigrescens]